MKKATAVFTGKLGFPVPTKVTLTKAIAGPIQHPTALVTPIPFPETRVYDGPIDSLTIYMREVGMVALLKPDEEVALAAKIKRGDKSARERMISANLRLVVKIAREYEGYGMPLMDMINEGNIGLMRAVEKFVPAKGGKLSTYSSWWIKQSIRRAIANQAKTVRMPIHMMDKIAKVRRTANRLSAELGQEATDEEIADEMGLPAKRISYLRNAGIHTTSMDAPIGDDDTNRMGDLIVDERAENPYDNLEHKSMLDLLDDIIGLLPPREFNILRRRFGLDGGREHSLEQIGKEMGVTRERIRQLQNLALGKLRKLITSRDAMLVAA
jgi:RNA polymerase primary sigma factor